jgi:multidrug efflux pump subunit AcrA (membrane-fusion protein)
MPTASWNQLERTIEHLHEAAREPIGVREFYRQLVAEAASALEAAGAAAWRGGADGQPELICQLLPDNGVEADWSARKQLVAKALTRGAAASCERPAEGDYEFLTCPVEQAVCDAASSAAAPVAAIELWMPRDASPPVRQGWLDFAAALADVAADFHARDELRRLRGASALRGHAVELMRRVGSPRTLEGAAFELANEGRRLLACDRLSVIVRRGGQWRLMAASGADAIARNEFARRCERLADQAARWGEPIETPSSTATGSDAELPPPLASAIEEHIDQSHARALACVPIKFPTGGAPTDVPSTTGFDAVLVAERFDAGGTLRESLVELGELCAPALARAAELDRFPIRAVLRWSQRLATLRRPGHLPRLLLAAGAIAGLLAALLFIRSDFDVEAPAHLATVIERDVFASATGAVTEVHVEHGQLVAAGDVLVVLSDPELALKLQETRGEIEATRKRLDALAVSRTDRSLHEDASTDRLPIAAEQRELAERLASLERQRELLEARSEALTLRSPIAGQVLTRDVQSLLQSRPVERGQALLTIADVGSGWELRADVPQRQVGHVIAAMNKNEADALVTADYRLAGGVQESHPAHVVAVSSAAPLEAEGLRDDAAPVEVRLAIDGDPPLAVRPGMTATVRIHCGRRPLGYVWLHDVGATLYRWATF